MNGVLVAGTGHRPDKLGGYSDRVFNRLVCLAEMQIKLVQPDRIISGMALGWDQALAQAAVNLGRPFHAYVPFSGYHRRWPRGSQELFDRLLVRAALVLICDNGAYHPGLMQKRNETMVDESTHIWALYNGDLHGGTFNCIRYAHKKKREVVNLWNMWMEMR